MTRRKDKTDNPLQQDLQGLVQVLDAAGRASLPLSGDVLLHLIVEAATSIFHAAAASIMLVNKAKGVLEFKASVGSANQELVGMSFPLDQGIAGYVAMTGQPIAISNVEQDSRFNRDFARSTGYVPRSILAMPLVSGENILGVIEVLDKIDALSFDMQEIELLGLFARQAALAIEISQGAEQIGRLFVTGLKKLALNESIYPSDNLISILEEEPDATLSSDLLEMAGLLNQFRRLGENERKTALKVLDAFVDYGQSSHRRGRGVYHR